ncbi:Putative D-isomer specific 2-hydroxyacid dehydrogenase, catalytic domain, ACT-like protein [Septoria linicola]|uniref:D-3-phosphoglycerate dehydrogenase n=1 Tax=Septoria linicola TaxID=215465 RepID=A0A9Q9EDX9_9PEZI|nr:Putative D-isomer specific 2-hydroxyacid dehydrogenase, catalytic domain, ACT-like protein [Septoria linicola]
MGLGLTFELHALRTRVPRALATWVAAGIAPHKNRQRTGIDNLWTHIPAASTSNNISFWHSLSSSPVPIIPQAQFANGDSRPKVLIPEKVSPDGLKLLQASLDVHEKKGLSADQLEEIIGDYEALIVRSETKVTASLLAAGKKLRVVARAGVGVDNVDLEAATKLGIIVINSPQGNINAAAEHSIALMMAVARNIGAASISIKSGKWERSKLVGVEVKGKTLGVLGLGKVGLTVARAAGGLGMNLVAYDPYANVTAAAAANVELVDSLDELLEQADFLTIHTPMIASTKGMIGLSELSKMKKTARVLNVARGGIIDEAALLEALETGVIAGAGVDVFTSEPPKEGDTASKLINHPNVVATPHLGASTVEAQENVSIDVCEQCLSILSGQLPRSAVNAPIILAEEFRTLAPFVALLEKMGSLYTQHFGPSNSAQRLRTTFDLTYEGTLASTNTTKPLFAALIKGLLQPITAAENTNINIVNAELVAKERGIFVNENRAREKVEGSEGYAASVTLRARHDPRSPSASRTRPEVERTSTGRVKKLEDHVISGFVSNNTPYISRLGRFSTQFVPEGTLLICRNYDSPGKIGTVGGRLGLAGVNIKFMSVAPIDDGKPPVAAEPATSGAVGKHGKENEALMILGVDRAIDDAVKQDLLNEQGVFEVAVVALD